jgi:hypothetical protein
MFVSQRRTLLVVIHVNDGECLFAYVSASKNAECFQCNFDKIFVLFTVQTFVEISQAAFSVLISVNCRTLKFSNLQLQM